MEHKPENQEHEQPEQEKRDYSFMREIIKKKPVSGRLLLRRILCLVGGAVLAGVIAAFVFVWMVPVAENLIREGSSRVSISDSSESSSGTSASSSSEEEVEEETEPSDKPTPRLHRPLV